MFRVVDLLESGAKLTFIILSLLMQAASCRGYCLYPQSTEGHCESSKCCPNGIKEGIKKPRLQRFHS